MNVGPDNREPLDAEERALAARLERMGPFEDPSPALDAKILVAAHAAAPARRTSRRGRLAWIGIPPALVTGTGIAAAAVLALGLVWQLRPRISVLPAAEESSAGAGEEVFVMAEPATTPRPQIINPPPLPAEPGAASARSAPADRAARASAATQKAAGPAAEIAAESHAIATTPPAPPAAVEEEAATAAADAMVSEPSFVPEPPAATAPAAAAAVAAEAEVATARRRASYTTSARATAERRERARALAAPQPQAAPTPAPAAAESDDAVLDRIEVTGSRVRNDEAVPLSQVATSEDRELEPAEWLERIRARRDEGDLDGARASLRLFRREHPRVRVPEDLRVLLTPAQ